MNSSLYKNMLQYMAMGMDELKYKPVRKAKRSSIKDHKRRTQQGRNEPCDCGSGKKFKKCCGKVINEEE